ncbi:carboxylesterase/lipase family protein [Agrobacterium sp. 22-221-1]
MLFAHRPTMIGVMLLSFAAPAAHAVTQPVSAPVGEVVGQEQGDLLVYQGIPYARPPIGDLRFAPPREAEPFKQPFVADVPGNECVQHAVFWRPDKGASWTEDCLTLTIYRPQGDAGNLPVIVGYHGGGSRNGAKTDWDPKEIARRGNIVVTANYRLGALGYLALAELNAESQDGKSSGNFGDLDKIEALKWVKKNIAAFGGNPERVVVAGQSGGARGVCFIVASPQAKGLFHGAIIESGRDCPSTPNEKAVESGEKFAAAIGCADKATRLACLRGKSPDEILDAQEKSALTLPTVSGGYAMPKPPLEAFETGEFNRVPVIVGNTRNEARIFVYEANDLKDQPVSQAQYRAEVRKNEGDKAEKILAAYSAIETTAPGAALADYSTDRGSTCPTTKLVTALARWTPTYAYEFRDETAPLRSYASVPQSFAVGSGHSSEISYLWGESMVPAGLTTRQLKLAEVMRRYFSALADPKGMPPEWPRFTVETPQRLAFLEDGITKVISEDEYRADHRCDLWQAAK